MRVAAGLRVGIVGCGLIGEKRADALRPEDQLLGTTDVCSHRARALADRYDAQACGDLNELLALEPDARWSWP